MNFSPIFYTVVFISVFSISIGYYFYKNDAQIAEPIATIEDQITWPLGPIEDQAILPISQLDSQIKENFIFKVGKMTVIFQVLMKCWNNVSNNDWNV